MNRFPIEAKGDRIEIDQVPRLHARSSVLRSLIEITRQGLQAAGVDVRRHRPPATTESTSSAQVFDELIALRRNAAALDCSDDEEAFLRFCAGHIMHSSSQLLQDLFVLHECKSKCAGFFVEFGATDGVSINNTVLLERGFNWSGILAEPARGWHARLFANRRSQISTECVWHTTGNTLIFNETADKELSTIDEIAVNDRHHAARLHGERYEVASISLNDLLEINHAPSTIDYLSIDTEGSEFEILRAFDFDKYDVRIITVEHNYTASRELLYELLARNGYKRKFEALSRWDDWYVRQ